MKTNFRHKEEIRVSFVTHRLWQTLSRKARTIFFIQYLRQHKETIVPQGKRKT